MNPNEPHQYGQQPPPQGYGQQPPPEGYGQQPPAGYGHPSQGQYAGAQWQGGQPPKKSNKMLIIVAAVTVVVVGVATTLILLLTGGSDPKETVEDFMAAVDAKDKSTITDLTRGDLSDDISSILGAESEIDFGSGTVGEVYEETVGKGDAAIVDFTLTAQGETENVDILLLDDGDGYQLCSIGKIKNSEITKAVDELC